ncbi:DUF1692-domain-containing protein [Hortaea werneckii]|nr:DUF1692-domain-containing protein [Hortaea werneckii]
MLPGFPFSSLPLPYPPSSTSSCGISRIEPVRSQPRGFLERGLRGAVERVEVVVGPGGGEDLLRGGSIRELGSEAEVVDVVREGMLDAFAACEVVLKIVHVHVAVAEGFPRREVEVTDDLVHADPAFDAAPFAPLRVEVLAVVFAFALFYVLAPAEGPAYAGVGVAHFGASVAAAGFHGVGGGGRAVALAAVFRVEMLAAIVGAQLEGFAFDFPAAFAFAPQPDLVHAVHDAGLDFAAHVHDVEGEQFAGDAREGDVHVDLHLLASALVDDEFGVDGNSAVVGPFAPDEVEDEEEGGEGDDAAGGGADAGIFDRLGEGVEAGESGFGGHFGIEGIR